VDVSGTQCMRRVRAMWPNNNNNNSNNNKQCAYWFAVAQTQAGTVRHRKKVSTLAGRSLAGPGTSFAESRPDADAGVERRHEREIEQ